MLISTYVFTHIKTYTTLSIHDTLEMLKTHCLYTDLLITEQDTLPISDYKLSKEMNDNNIFGYYQTVIIRNHYMLQRIIILAPIPHKIKCKYLKHINWKKGSCIDTINYLHFLAVPETLKVTDTSVTIYNPNCSS
jgi:hypothetical protein